MKLDALEAAVVGHAGTFTCRQIHDHAVTKDVAFHHVVSPPVEGIDLPDIGRLVDFYDTFGSLLLYSDPVSNDAAIDIAAPLMWRGLHADFKAWTGALSTKESEELLPDWIDAALVIGEEPRTGNYLLMPTTGPDAGHVFLFDHDGFEFHEVRRTSSPTWSGCSLPTTGCCAFSRRTCASWKATQMCSGPYATTATIAGGSRLRGPEVSYAATIPLVRKSSCSAFFLSSCRCSSWLLLDRRPRRIP